MGLGNVSDIAEVKHDLGHAGVLAVEHVCHEAHGGGRLVGGHQWRTHHERRVDHCKLELLIICKYTWEGNFKNY